LIRGQKGKALDDVTNMLIRMLAIFAHPPKM